MPSIGIVMGYLAIAFIAVLTILGTRVLWRCVPFDLASYSAWAGIFLALFGIAALLAAWLLPRLMTSTWLGIRPAVAAFLLLVIGIGMTWTALLWPSTVHHHSGARHRIDDFLSEYQFAEYHEASTRAPLARVLEAARQVSLADMPAAVLLMRLRACAGGELKQVALDTTPLLTMMMSPGTGFMPLDTSNDAELVLGMAGRPWSEATPPKVDSAADFLAFSTPGHVRVVFDIRTVDEGGGIVKVSTETRILGNDTTARRVFARYWRLIYPGSAIIRRVWLDAIIARAERPVP